MSTIYGLTGGVGMGKSTVARLFAKAGTPVIDSDQLAREVVAPGQPALEKVREIFGGKFIKADGQLDRERMARHIFSDADARQQLESIIHPRVNERWRSEIEKWRAAGQGGVVVIPLLFEVDAAGHFDITLCVACSGATQLERLNERGWSKEQIGQRIAAQLSIEGKIDCADHVLWNEGGMDSLWSQLTRLGCVEKSSP